MERKMTPLIRFLTHPIGVYQGIGHNYLSNTINALKLLTICMSLHFSDILDSAFFTVCGIWSLTGYLRETCLWISSNLPLYKKGCFSTPQTKLNYGQSVQETTKRQNLCTGPPPLWTRIWVDAMIGLLCICRTVWDEFQNTLLAITGCPKSSFLYFISLYFSTIGLGKEIISTKVVSFNVIHYFHTCCAIFWLEYLICVLPRQRCACASLFSSLIFFVCHSLNYSNSFLVFLWISRKINPLNTKTFNFMRA